MIIMLHFTWFSSVRRIFFLQDHLKCIDTFVAHSILEAMEGYDYPTPQCMSFCTSHLNAFTYCEALHAMRFPDDWTQPPWRNFDEWRRIHRRWFTAEELIADYRQKLSQKEKDGQLRARILQDNQRSCKRMRTQFELPSQQSQEDTTKGRMAQTFHARRAAMDKEETTSQLRMRDYASAKHAQACVGLYHLSSESWFMLMPMLWFPLVMW